MIPVKIDANQITANPEKSLESIVDWFEHNKESFYTLGWSYLRNHEQMEELFYRVILKIHKELPRFKRETSFNNWISSIFIHMCRELSGENGLLASEESDLREDIFKALDQLKESEKEAIVLTYVIGISLEESAHILKISVEEMKARLFSGLQLLREKSGYGSHFDGCKDYYKLYIDYLERTLDRPKKIDFEMHIYHCQSCQEDLAAFQEVMSGMLELAGTMEEFQVPPGFMEKVKGRFAEKEKRRQLKIKKYKKRALVSASVFAVLVCTGFFTGWFSYLFYSWTEEDQQLRTFLQHGLGERLNLEAESEGVKITIKSVIADEIQTLLFYEIEDMNEENQYMMNYYDGIMVENENEIMNLAAQPKYYPPAQTKEEKNVYQGKLSLLPIVTDSETIKLKITRLQKLNDDPSNPDSFRDNGEMEYGRGEWNFEIPVTKLPSTEYSLDKEMEMEGIPVRINKLTIAPTATILHYGIQNVQSKKRIEFVNFASLEVNKKKVEIDPFRGSYPDLQQDMEWNNFVTHFDPLFKEKPKKVKVAFGSIYLGIEDRKMIALEKYPQSFEYAGSTISIDKVEVGGQSRVVISDTNIKNRQYESFYFHFVGNDDRDVSSIGMQNAVETVIVDKSGKEYDMNELPVPLEQLEWPRYFTTVQNIELFNNSTGEKVSPKKLEIFGYNTTKYVDDVVEVLLD
ncbi:sigma-70 family RNA polymerase sigma factor [Cytobacillus massiliigabonensis]|uniref:sigma-70 family RNA polymerase sigma factor n=1 Tax=Cytobacillus massiliigabonensis TaxID=1871011 RepID=UPI000C82DC39|nr:sigma-70 family RNA polymerase sigma factor [Cytobacillus massiliigabonensis]